MNSFIFLPRLLSIEPGITADRNHRESERDRYSCIFVRACRVFRISEWSRPAMPARFHTRPRWKMRAKYPSTWLRTPNATRSMHERPRMSRYSEFYYLDCERGRLVRSSLARLIPPRQPRTYENGYFSRPLEKLLPPLEPHGQRGGGGIFGTEKGREEGEGMRGIRIAAARKRGSKEGRATPRFFFLFLYVFFLSSNAEQIAYRRRFSFTLTRLPMVTIGIHI